MEQQPFNKIDLQSLYDVKSFIMNSEGFYSKVYRCTMGFLTIGYGFNLEASSAKSIMTKMGLDHKAYITGKKEMDRATAQRLFDYQYNEKIAYVDKNFQGLRFSSQREVLIDISFNIGSIPTSFTKFRQAVKNNDVKAMAIEILDSNYCSQVKTRCLKNAINLLNDASGANAQTLKAKVQ